MNIEALLQIILGIVSIIGIIYKIASTKAEIYKEIDRRADNLLLQIYELKARQTEHDIEARGKEAIQEMTIKQIQNDHQRNIRAVTGRITDIEGYLKEPSLNSFSIRSRDRYNLDIDSPNATDMQ